ncbi:hypothetical protein NE619_02175 [Anaerovorax odorimutans]|uniref:Uncharacterized protein n=1 Tax=Anaerovorax odorimutans TaxID=109327 RepID=A0ABT1RK22_9FIRM|nr:hypothetical protein [Anaerovorax odorimutans]MCQ4635523.1 hypothetical protein [Anaerovorax odorimutans]
MYIVLDIELRPKGAIDDEEMYNFPKKMLAVVNAFDVEFKKQRVRRRHYYSYKIKSTDGQYQAFLKFNEQYKKKLDIIIYPYTVYENQDYESASAYLLQFTNKCYYYDDYPDFEKYDCMEIASDALGQWYPRPPIYINLPIKTKRAFEKRIDGAITPDFESYLSPKLYEYLIKRGVDSSCFKEAYKKGRTYETVAYRLWGKEHTLPPESLFLFTEDDEYVWCQDPATGCVKWIPYEGEEGEAIEDYNWHLHGSLNPQIYTMTKAGIGALGYVSDSFEAWGNMRTTIVNPELFRLISEKVPEVRKRSIPIFRRDGAPPSYMKTVVEP